MGCQRPDTQMEMVCLHMSLSSFLCLFVHLSPDLANYSYSAKQLTRCLKLRKYFSALLNLPFIYCISDCVYGSYMKQNDCEAVTLQVLWCTVKEWQICRFLLSRAIALGKETQISANNNLIIDACQEAKAQSEEILLQLDNIITSRVPAALSYAQQLVSCMGK